MDFQFSPLELWRVSTLPQETKAVVTAYERCVAAGDARGVATLRALIERRIDDLENFYVANVDDERSVLFEKQRLKLRKLLHEFDTASYGPTSATAPASGDASAARGSAVPPPQLPPSSSSAPAPPPSVGYSAAASAAAPPAATTTRIVREDTRLTSAELCAWFEQAGRAEMPEATTAVVAGVFEQVTRVNTDGRLSIRELRQWYTTFGRRALQVAAQKAAADAATLTRQAGIVAPALIGAKTAAARRGAPVLGGHAASALAAVAGGAVGLLPAAGAFSSASGGYGAAAAAAGADLRPLYPWEAGAEAPEAAAGLDASQHSAPQQSHPRYAALPNGMLEFQVRLTPEEFAALSLRRRAGEAEARYKARMAAAQSSSTSLGALGKRGAAATDPRLHVPGTPYSSFNVGTPAQQQAAAGGLGFSGGPPHSVDRALAFGASASASGLREPYAPLHTHSSMPRETAIFRAS